MKFLSGVAPLFLATYVLMLPGVVLAVQSQAPQVNEQARIVVTGGTLTDIVFALGGDDHVVAVDTSSVSPARGQQKPKVGYYRELAAEGVLSVSPTHLWALEGTGSNQTVRQIERAGVSVVRFAKPDSIDELIELIDRVGALLAREAQAQALVASMKRDLEQVLRDTQSGDARPMPNALFVLQASERGIVAAGQDTVPNLLFDYAHVSNMVSHRGYKPVSSEFLAVSQPDFLVAPSHVVDAYGGREQFCAQSGLRLIAAARDCKLLVLDSLLALGMTTEIAHAIQQVFEYAHDDLSV